jgi:2-polyprenyl-3-methyl-5-hydroxy-6-metoxy-1,4-benzoquinol methylase
VNREASEGTNVPRVVITLPAYKAQDTLAKTIADIPEGVADELIVVDDASPDGTAELARAMGIQVHVHSSNRGYGGNQKTCYTEALRSGADIIVLLHPDYQYDPKAVPLLIAPILAGDADMTFGSRFAGLGNPLAGGMPMYRYLGNRLTTTLENLMLGSRFTDMHSGLRAYTRDCLLSIPYLGYADDFVFDSQFLVDAVTSGQRVVEVPIPTRYTKESSSISVMPSLRYVTASLAYCARRTLARGRRGSRSPTTSSGRVRRAERLGTSRAADKVCVLCGSHIHALVYEANVSGDVPVMEFACTTGELAQHDDIVRCVECGLVSSNPTLAPEAIVGNYEQVVDEAYLDEERGRRELFRWFLQRVKAMPTRGSTLLEVGSNMGLFLAVAEEMGFEATGVEPSRWAVAQGRERFGVDLHQGTVEDLPVEVDRVDVAVMLDVLEHVTDPVAALKALRARMDDEGLLLLSTVNLDGLHARARGGDWPWFIRSHLYYFSKATLAATLKEAGFRMVEFSIVPRSFHLSYVAERARSSHPELARAADAIARVSDVRIPTGWLGDITCVLARPDA